MIIGSSYDANEYAYFRHQETGELIECNVFFDESFQYYIENEETFVFLGKNIENFIDSDNWSYAKEFDSSEVVLLLECDYCGIYFTNTWKNRRAKATGYLGNFYEKTGSQKFNDDHIDLYKDNCDDCLSKKQQETTMIKNHYWHPSQTEAHKERMRNTLKMHNLVPTSRGQRYIAKMLGAELNVLVDYYFADMILDDKIVIEYDGGGHNLSVLRGEITQAEFDRREQKRSEHLFSKGYKLLRFISPSELFPECEKTTKEIICSAIAELYLSDLKEIHITMADRVNDPVYGKLKPIKSILEESEWGEELL